MILEEIHMHEDSPEDVVHDVFTEAPVAGASARASDPRDRGADPRGDARGASAAFYRRHYVPGNLVVAVAGNVRHDDVVRMLRDRMETGQRCDRPGATRAWNLRRATGRAQARRAASPSARKTTEQAHVVIGTNGVPRTDPERFAFWVVNTALGGGMSSRLFQEIREKRGLAYTAYSYHAQYTEAGLFGAYAGTTPARADEVVALDPARARGRARRGADARGVRAREGPRPRGHRALARGPGRADVAAREVRDRARRDPHGGRDAAAPARR